MELIQIANILNNTIVPNLLGQDVTIASDLSNLVELGTAIADVDADVVKNYAKSFIVGVARNVMDTRRYKSETYGLMSDAREYGGIIQRVKAGILDVEDTPIWTLEDGQNYFDGTYHAIDFDVKIYSKDNAFMICNSVPTEMFKQWFTSEDGVRNLISLIEASVDNTMTVQMNGLARTTLQQMIVTASTDRTIPLLTMYNTATGSTLTADDALNNASFLRWSARQIVRLRNMVTDINNKYNDGTIKTFTPREDLRVTMLDEFSNALQFNMESDTFHNDLVSVGEFNTINFWQNASDDLLPSLGVTAEVKASNGDEEDITVSNVIGLIFDRYTGGVTASLNKTTADYIPKGDFTTYFHHVANSRFVDTRNTAIVLTLN